MAAESKVPTMQVQATRQRQLNDKDEVVKTLYNLTISNGTKTITMSVGEKTYNAVKEMSTSK